MMIMVMYSANIYTTVILKVLHVNLRNLQEY